ncbi:hypothetical protein EQV77_16715 [Halobacillus fulvus]|nr:hypothetical protein EQV77_16715 [Halobacillus fulvus]
MKKKRPFILSIVIALVVVLIGWQVIDRMTTTEKLTAVQAEERIKEQYSGEILELMDNGDTYIAMMELNGNRYRIEVSQEDGSVVQVEQLETQGENSNAPAEEEPQPQQDPPSSTEEPQTEQPAEPAQPISEQEARSIALEQVTGTIDDVDFEQSNGQSYYLIEMERDDDLEATVQIHAITGEVLSVTWDD